MTGYNVKIALINDSTVLSDDDIRKVIPSFNTQLGRDFGPAWGVEAHIRFIGKNQKIPRGYWWVVILDDADGAGYLGYHDITEEGMPLGKVFAKTDLDYGYNWTITATHEILEMLADPDINLVAFVEEGEFAGKLFAYEVCDPCEADEFGYDINGVKVSDFVTPAYFEYFRKDTQGFDYLNKITKPFELLPGGYISVYDINSKDGWQMLSASNPDKRTLVRMRAPVGSRRERRRTPKSQWVESEPMMEMRTEENTEEPEPSNE
jgi:hypothetical protein